MSYSYTVTRCPKCKADLTKEDAISLVTSAGGVRETPTRLDEDGDLIDVEDLVANGYHSETRCGSCDKSLVDFEIQEDAS